MLSVAIAVIALLPSATDTLHYTVMGHDRIAGAMRVIRSADSAVVRFYYQDRQRGPRRETRYSFGPGGIPVRMVIRSLGPDLQLRDTTEAFTSTADAAWWIANRDTTRVAVRN